MIRSTQMRNLFLAGAACLAVAGAAAQPAFADIASSKAAVDAAKMQGVVGEQADGFLGIVKGGGSYVMFGDGTLAACKPISEADLARFMADCVRGEWSWRSGVVVVVGGGGGAVVLL